MKNFSLFISVFLLFSRMCAAQSVPDITGSKLDQISAQAALDFHNKVRSDVGSPRLTWSTKLAEFAQSWADYLSFDLNCELKHSSGQYGENIFWGSTENYSALYASKTWYDEIKNYKYGPIGDDWYKSGHYTQMVWHESNILGIGRSVCPNGSVIFVATYSPAGNVTGRAPY